MTEPRLIPGLVFRGTWDIKNAFVLVLREIFSDQAIVGEQFLYTPAPDQPTRDGDDDGGSFETKIRIYKGFPKRINSYPSIVVTSLPFDAPLTGMGEEGEEAGDGFQDGILVARSYTGYLIIPIEVRVYSKDSTDERDRLIDILYLMLRVIRRTFFHRFGFGYVGIRFSGEDQSAEPGSEYLIHTNSLVLECNTDYSYNLTVDQQAMFSKILIKVDGRTKPGDPLVPLDPPPYPF
jgi:hypothetical protein